MHYRITLNLNINNSPSLLCEYCKSSVGCYYLATPNLPEDSYYTVVSLLNSLILDILQMQLVNLLKQARECIAKRQQLIQQFKYDFHILATEFVATLPTTHPELYL